MEIKKDTVVKIEPDELADIIKRHFREYEELKGLEFSNVRIFNEEHHGEDDYDEYDIFSDVFPGDYYEIRFKPAEPRKR